MHVDQNTEKVIQNKNKTKKKKKKKKKADFNSTTTQNVCKFPGQTPSSVRPDNYNRTGRLGVKYQVTCLSSFSCNKLSAYLVTLGAGVNFVSHFVVLNAGFIAACISLTSQVRDTVGGSGLRCVR